MNPPPDDELKVLDITISEMYRLAHDYQDDVKKYFFGSPDQVFDFVKKIPYKTDFDSCNEDECLKRPMYGAIEGDCDDKTIFSGAAFNLLGNDWRIVTVSYLPTKEIHHVYCELFEGGQWLPFDATYDTNKIYFEKPYTKKIVWPNPMKKIYFNNGGGVSLEGDGRITAIGHGQNPREYIAGYNRAATVGNVTLLADHVTTQRRVTIGTDIVPAQDPGITPVVPAQDPGITPVTTSGIPNATDWQQLLTAAGSAKYGSSFSTAGISGSQISSTLAGLAAFLVPTGPIGAIVEGLAGILSQLGIKLPTQHLTQDAAWQIALQISNPLEKLYDALPADGQTYLAQLGQACATAWNNQYFSWWGGAYQNYWNSNYNNANFGTQRSRFVNNLRIPISGIMAQVDMAAAQQNLQQWIVAENLNPRLFVPLQAYMAARFNQVVQFNQSGIITTPLPSAQSLSLSSISGSTLLLWGLGIGAVIWVISSDKKQGAKR